MSSREFAEWVAYSRIEPFGERRADLRSATVAQVMYNMWRGSSDPAKTAADFMPDFERAKGAQQQTVEQMQANLMRALGGLLKRKGS